MQEKALNLVMKQVAKDIPVVPNKDAKQQKITGHEIMKNFNLPVDEPEDEEELWYGLVGGSKDEVVAGKTEAGTDLAGHRPIQTGTSPSRAEPKPSPRAPGFYTPQGMNSL